MKVRRFQPEDVGAIARLNARLQAGKVADVVYPEGAEQHRQSDVRERLFVAEDDGEIRGAVWLREQCFRVAGEDVVCGWLKYPISESLLDSRFSGVPGSLIVQCLREQPRLLALGLGGHDTPIARMLKALRWTGTTVPLLARLVRPARALRQIVPLRRSRARRAAVDVLALTGLGWLAVQTYSAFRASTSGHRRGAYQGDPTATLGAWADDVWAITRDEYRFAAARDVATVESLLPASPDVSRLRVRRAGEDVGWVIVVCHDFRTGLADRNFGRLTVGLIADCVAAPTHAAGVVGVAYDYLAAQGADIVISNQLYPAWTTGLRAAGFLPVPSNFAFYASPAATRLTGDWSGCHVNRGDCDGPIWYAAP